MAHDSEPAIITHFTVKSLKIKDNFAGGNLPLLLDNVLSKETKMSQMFDKNIKTIKTKRK